MTTEFVRQQMRRYDALRQRRVNFDSLWQEIADYMVPRKREIITTHTQGTRQTVRIYDGTALGVIEVAVSAIDGTMTPSTIRWFSLRIEEEGFDDYNDALSMISGFMFNALNSSNFKAEMQEVYEDLLVFGTACLYIEETELHPSGDFSGLRFQSFPPGSYVIAENASGFVETVYRDFELDVDAAVERFGLENLCEATQDKFRSGKLDEPVSFLHGVFPKRSVPASMLQGVNVPDQMDYVSVYMEKGTGKWGDAKTDRGLVESGGYKTFPYIVARWRKTSGEVYGRSPGMNAIDDIRTLNEAVKMRLQQWQLAIRPPIGVPHRGVLGQINLTPGAINTFQGNPRDSYHEMVTTVNFNAASFQEEQIRAAIRSRFYVDQIQFPANTGQTPFTATEFAGRFEVMQRILGPVLGRMEYELLEFALKRVFSIMVDTGALPNIDPEILDITQIKFEGPLARTQRGSDIEAVSRAVSLLIPMAEIMPEVLDRLDGKKIAKFIPERSGVPAHLIRNDEDVAAIEQGRLEAQQQRAQQEALVQGSQAIRNVAPMAQAVNSMGQQEPVPSGV